MDQATFIQEVADIAPTLQAALDAQSALADAQAAKDAADATAQADIDAKQGVSDSATTAQIVKLQQLVNDATALLATITPPSG